TAVDAGANLLSVCERCRRAGAYASGPEAGEPYPEVVDEGSPELGVGPFQGIPLVAVATDFGLAQPVAFGFGITSQHGYPGRRYSTDYTFEDPSVSGPPQRYDVLEQDVAAAFLSAAAAYEVTRQLAVGARLSWGLVSLRGKSAVWALPGNFDEDVATDGLVEID